MAKNNLAQDSSGNIKEALMMRASKGRTARSGDRVSHVPQSVVQRPPECPERGREEGVLEAGAGSM